MSNKKSALDDFRQQTSMSQKLANKRGYSQMVEYIGDIDTALKLARLNVMIDQDLLKKGDPIVEYMKARLVEDSKAYFMTTRANEVSCLGMMIGDNRKRSSGIKKRK